jgi:pimeloyl-ACP methyl ester carboxylesterase
MLRRVRKASRVYTAQELAQIGVPTLLIIGDQERIYPPLEAMKSSVRLMPGIRAELIPGAHHIAAIAQPELVNNRMLAFLNDGKY